MLNTLLVLARAIKRGLTPKPPRPTRLYFRPNLEALEPRYAPAQRVWLGTVSADPTVPGNWLGNAAPGLADEAIFDNRAIENFLLDDDDTLEVGKLTVAANFTKTFHVAGTLIVSQGSLGGNSTWVSAQFLNLLNGADFYLRGDRTMEFSNGGVNQSGQGAGTIDLRLGATLKLTGNASRLDGNLRVGDGVTAGTVELVGLSGNVYNQTGKILVTSTGTFKMTQTGDTSQAPKGSLYSAGNSDATFTNQGLFIRDGATSGPYDPEVEFVFINTGILRVTSGSNLRFTKTDSNNYSLINKSPGIVELHYGSFVRATGAYKQEGGVFETHGDANGFGSVYFLMPSDFLGGVLHVNKDGGFGTLQFGANNVKFAGALMVYLEVDGASPPGAGATGDQINLDGGATLTIDNSQPNKPTLVVTTLRGVPPPGWSFDLINTPILVNTFADVIFAGQFTPQGGYTVSYPPGPPREVRITV